MIPLPSSAPRDPLPLVQEWLDDAVRASAQRNPAAMTLATADGTGHVSARMVLLKGIDAEGYGRFYTHYESRKAKQLAANPWAAGVMHWDALGRQLRLEGHVRPAPAAESDRYFASRPWRSQLNAWASWQSRPLIDDELERRAIYRASELGLPDPFDASAPEQVTTAVPRPPWWGGYRFWFSMIELWEEGEGRFHRRLRYTRALHLSSDAIATGPWAHERLQP